MSISIHNSRLSSGSGTVRGRVSQGNGKNPPTCVDRAVAFLNRVDNSVQERIDNFFIRCEPEEPATQRSDSCSFKKMDDDLGRFFHNGFKEMKADFFELIDGYCRNVEIDMRPIKMDKKIGCGSSRSGHLRQGKRKNPSTCLDGVAKECCNSLRKVDTWMTQFFDGVLNKCETSRWDSPPITSPSRRRPMHTPGSVSGPPYFQNVSRISRCSEVRIDTPSSSTNRDSSTMELSQNSAFFSPKALSEADSPTVGGLYNSTLSSQASPPQYGSNCSWEGKANANTNTNTVYV
jgi:hypothetical protein